MEGGAISSAAEGCVIAVWVVPRARRDEIAGVHGEMLRIRVRALPLRGAATRAAQTVLATALGGAEVALLRGSRSRRKLFRVAMPADEARRRLEL